MAGQTIYHYTGLKGLMGIVEHKRLWATDVRYLNDTSESTYGDARLSALLNEEMSTGQMHRVYASRSSPTGVTSQRTSVFS